MHKGIGGKSALIYIDETPVFVKKIPLTDLEQLPQNFRSTANLFNLPLCYQYGVGSAGFGAWRELATHVMTTNWVITDECPNFPIMYHWRILPNEPSEPNLEEWGDIEQYSHYWENSSAIRNRIEALNKASAHIALFLEYIPKNLYEWLPAEIAKGGLISETAIAFVDDNLKTANIYMNTHGLMHFDAHFNNILTDGELIYLSDFGLALSSKFELAPSETEFLKRHQTYDRAYASLNLLLSIFSAIFKKDQWEIRPHEYVEREEIRLLPAIAKIIEKYAPTALIMDEFLEKLRKKSKLTLYPETQLEKLLTKNSSEKHDHHH